MNLNPQPSVKVIPLVLNPRELATGVHKKFCMCQMPFN